MKFGIGEKRKREGERGKSENSGKGGKGERGKGEDTHDEIG